MMRSASRTLLLPAAFAPTNTVSGPTSNVPWAKLLKFVSSMRLSMSPSYQPDAHAGTNLGEQGRALDFEPRRTRRTRSLGVEEEADAVGEARTCGCVRF